MEIPKINKVKEIAIDFDATLYNRETDQPYSYAHEAVKWLKKWGYTITIYSGRATSPENIQWMREWLKQKGIIFDTITNIKPTRVTWIIDDRAITFTDNWIEITEAIKKETFPWK